MRVFLLLSVLSVSLPVATLNDTDIRQCGTNFLGGKYGVQGAVDKDGNPVDSLSQASGLLYAQCISYCGDGSELYPWDVLSNTLSAWLFPWLVLVAQMPFQTKSKRTDVWSTCLIIGSPILAMYSLLVTMHNSKWIHRKCWKVGKTYKDSEHLEYVAFVLSSCQQVPLQFDSAFLACSISLSQNKDWWKELALRLRDTRRTLPESLWPQNVVVIGTYIFTIVDAFRTIGGRYSVFL